MDYTDEQLLKLDPELEKIFQDRGPPRLPLPTRDNIKVTRAGFNKACQRYNESPFAKFVLGKQYSEPDWVEADHNVKVRDGSHITVRSYTPEPTSGKSYPIIVQIHGGGWCFGGLSTDSLQCRMMCSKLNVVVVDIDYRLLPDVAFGVPQTDCYDALKWILSHSKIFRGDPAKGLILSGNSGGGTYVTATAYLALNDELQPPITGCYLACPIFTDEVLNESGNRTHLFDQQVEYRSTQQNKDAPLMNEAMRLSIEKLAEYDWTSPLLSPFQFETFAGLPPTYISVCGLDPWRDGGVLYRLGLERAGVKCKLDVYPGLPHTWWTTFPQISATQEWLTNTMRGLKWLLDQGMSTTAKL